MGYNVGTLQEIICSFLSPIFQSGGITPGTPLTPAGLTVNGVDLSLLALNNARRVAEKAHDFYYSKGDVTLSISSTGASITNAIGSVSGVTVTGTLSPDATGTYTQTGMYDGSLLFTSSTGAYTLYFSGVNWILTNDPFNPTNYWFLNTSPFNPAGSYAAHGSNTGTAVIAGTANAVGFKRVETVKLPLAAGDLVPIEFLTDDDWRSRMQREYGRQAWNPNLTLYQLGVGQSNPTCYQQGQKVFLVPASQFSFPVTATLSVIQWLPDYTQATDTDFFTEFAPDYLQWQGIIECNKLTKWFTQRREGNIDESNLQVEAQRAMEALLAWDLSISGGTTTPNAPLAPAAAPQAQSAA